MYAVGLAHICAECPPTPICQVTECVKLRARAGGAPWHDRQMPNRTIRALFRSPRTQRALTNGLALCVLGCGGAAQPKTRDVQRMAQASASSGKSFRDVKVNADAKPLDVACEYGAYETCNAIDDDCNGVIDDDCGYETGDVQVTVSWNSGADIDLYVTDPSGFTLFYNEQHKHSQAGGFLDHDARGDCRREQKNPRIENAYWGSAKRGNYKVELHYFSPCTNGSTTEVTLSVVVGRELLGAYRYKLDPEQRVEALSFSKL